MEEKYFNKRQQEKYVFSAAFKIIIISIKMLFIDPIYQILHSIHKFQKHNMSPFCQNHEYHFQFNF